MPGILADHDVQANFARLLDVWLCDDWRSIWRELKIAVESFESLQLPRDASDAVLWKACQKQHVVLITGNRNASGAESLESTVRDLNQPDSLPVFTLANPRRIIEDSAHARRVAERLLDYLMRIEDLRGTGRIYLP